MRSISDENLHNQTNVALPDIAPGVNVEIKPGGLKPGATPPPPTADPPTLTQPVDGAAMPKIESVPGGGGGVKMKMKRAAQIGVAPVQMVQHLPSFAWRHRNALMIIGALVVVAIFTTSYFTKKASDARKRDAVLAGSQRSMDKVNARFADASSLKELRVATNTAKYEKGTNGGRTILLTNVSGGDRSPLTGVLAAEGALLGAYASLAGATQENLSSKRRTDAMITDIKEAVRNLQAATKAAVAGGVDVKTNAKLLTAAQANILKLLREARGKKPKPVAKKSTTTAAQKQAAQIQQAPATGSAKSSGGGTTTKKESNRSGGNGGGDKSGAGGAPGGSSTDSPSVGE